MKILILNGPNLNMLGVRNQSVYGFLTLEKIENRLESIAKENNAEIVFFQSNHEGSLIDFIQKNSADAHGILINPGALTHYGYSLRDGLVDSKLPVVEVHLSNILQREEFRKVDVLKDIVIKVVMGKKEKSYEEGLVYLLKYLKKSP